MTAPHPDDEELSAHLDGEAGAATTAHLASCPQCDGRLHRLEAAASRVAAPVRPPDDGVRQAAMAAALEAFASPGPGVEAGGGVIVPVHGRRRRPRWALPLAAAAAALLLAVPVLSSLGDGSDRTDTAATSEGDDSRGSVEIAGTDGGDLGEQSDPATLGLAIRGALPGAASAAALAARPGPEGGGTGDFTGPQASAPPEPVESPGAVPESKTAAAKPLVDPPCATSARASYGKGLGPLVYAARLRWQGEPAVVLAYRLAEAGAPGLDYRVLVMAREGCRLLVVQSL